eukprot:SAG31_NODE_42262_length_272_cov_0.890173_2_plen_68_part_01
MPEQLLQGRSQPHTSIKCAGLLECLRLPPCDVLAHARQRWEAFDDAGDTRRLSMQRAPRGRMVAKWLG